MLRGGDTCQGDSECRSGWCGPGQICIEPCRNSEPPPSCVEGARCENVSLPLWESDSMVEAWTANSEVCR